MDWRTAVSSARRALEALPRGIDGAIKKNVLMRLAELILEDKDRLVTLALENGYDFLFAGELGSEINKASARIKYYARNIVESIVVCPDTELMLIRRPAGIFAGYTAPNYPFIESAAVSGFINSVLSGCPMVVRAGALPGAIDKAMVELASRAMRECGGPRDFIQICEVSRDETDAFLAEVDFLYFIGGPVGYELMQKTRKKYGVVQTGLPNAAIVYPGAEGVAATKLGEQFGARLALSCSNTTGVLLHRDCDLAKFSSALAECALASCHARDNQLGRAAERFQDGLKTSLQYYLDRGAEWYPVAGQSEYDRLSFGLDPIILRSGSTLFQRQANPPELFGRALIVCAHGREDWIQALRELAPTKTIQAFHPDNMLPAADENVLITQTSRLIADADGKVNQPDPGPCSIHGNPEFGFAQVIDPLEFVIRMTLVRP